MEPNIQGTLQSDTNSFTTIEPHIEDVLRPTNQSKKYLPLIVITIVILVIAAITSYFLISNSSIRSTKSASSSSAPVKQQPVMSSDLPTIENSENTLAYLSDPNPDVMGDNEIYIIDVNTGTKTKLDIKNVMNVYKYLNSTKLYYISGENDGFINIYDLKLGTNSPYKLISHPLDSVKESISINSIESISPSGKYLIFQASFYEDCPPMSPFPDGFEGGNGPCGPDENLDYPTGNYLYNISTGKATPLIDLYRVSRWDEDNHKLYYITDKSTKTLDLNLNTLSLYDSTSSFGYFVYPLFKSNSYVKVEGSVEKGVRIYLSNSDKKELAEIESVKPWAVLQPFIQASPDERYVIYVKTELDSQSIRHNYLYKYDLIQKTSTALTPNDKNSNYLASISWIDDHTFVTLEEVINNKDYVKSTKNLVKIDIQTGDLMPLTSKTNVYQFNIQ